jgi:hypothetical protein
MRAFAVVLLVGALSLVGCQPHPDPTPTTTTTTTSSTPTTTVITTTPPADSAFLALSHRSYSCPPIDVLFTSTDPDRWQICALPNRTSGILTNISDEVLSIGIPRATGASQHTFDQSPAATSLRATMHSLQTMVSQGTVKDPSLGNSETFLYLLPDDYVVFAGQGDALGGITASTSFQATTVAAVSRTMYTRAFEVTSSGQSTGTQQAGFLATLKNPIAECARNALDFVNLNSPSLVDTVTNAINTGKSCKSALELFQEADREGSASQEAEVTLRSRFATFGRNAAKEPGFWEDGWRLATDVFRTVH